MNKFSKVIALTLSATMIFGSSLTVFADDPASTEPVTTGDSTGEGAPEGHVEKKKMNVVLPTMPESGSPFAYTIDPEGLIKETAHAAYADTTEWPAADKDTQVYFNNGKKGGDGTDKDNIVYANTSTAQKVTNKSSHDIKLTVTAEVAESNDTDIPLVAQTAIASASDPALYLGLLVDDEDAATISSTEAASVEVTIAGNEDNFKISYDSTKKKYEYRVLTLEEYKVKVNDDSKTEDDFNETWESSEFMLEGAVAKKAITDTTTAPSIKVTWNWVDPDATPAEVAPSVPTTKTITAGENATIAVNLGTGEDVAATGITALKWGKSADSTTTTLTAGTHYTYSDGVITLLPAVSSGASGTRYLKVVFTGGATPTNDTVEVTIE